MDEITTGRTGVKTMYVEKNITACYKVGEGAVDQTCPENEQHSIRTLVLEEISAAEKNRERRVD